MKGYEMKEKILLIISELFQNDNFKDAELLLRRTPQILHFCKIFDSDGYSSKTLKTMMQETGKGKHFVENTVRVMYKFGLVQECGKSGYRFNYKLISE